MDIESLLDNTYYRIEFSKNISFHTLRNFLYSFMATRNKDEIEEHRKNLIISYGLEEHTSDIKVEPYQKKARLFHWG